MAMTDKATNTPPKIFVQPYMNRGGVAAKDLILIAIALLQYYVKKQIGRCGGGGGGGTWRQGTAWFD